MPCPQRGMEVGDAKAVAPAVQGRPGGGETFEVQQLRAMEQPSWSEGRLDDLNRKVDDGIGRLDGERKELRVEMKAGFDKVVTAIRELTGVLTGELPAAAQKGIRRLNLRHGGDGRKRFHLFHRERRWNPMEGKWMGWERKRGKLEELNQLLVGGRETSFAVEVDPPEDLEDIRYVLTLDADTAWRVLSTRRKKPALQPRIEIAGDRDLAAGFTRTVAVMA